MTVLILGGCRSGKSDYAQQIALRMANGGTRYYLATMIPGDREDDARVESHLRRRAGMGFETIEQGRYLLQALERSDVNGAYLLDSVTTLLTNELFHPENGYEPDEEAALRCCGDVLEFASRVKNAVIVADNLFCDAARYSASTDSFRRHLGRICCALAEQCDCVLEMSSGNLIVHKGEWKA